MKLEKPTIEFVGLSKESIVVTSGCTESPTQSPGYTECLGLPSSENVDQCWHEPGSQYKE